MAVDFDFRVYTAAAQAVRDFAAASVGWPAGTTPEDKLLSGFFGLPIKPFVGPNSDFKPYAARYDSKVKDLTGAQTLVEDFDHKGKKFKDFFQFRTGRPVDRILFSTILALHKSGAVSIPALSTSSSVTTLLKIVIDAANHEGLKSALPMILEPIATGNGVAPSPSVETEFPNIKLIDDATAVGKTFGELMKEATN